MYLACDTPRNINLWPAARCDTPKQGMTVFWSCFSTVSNARASHAPIAISLPRFCSEFLVLGVASFSLVAIAVGARSNEQLQERAQAKGHAELEVSTCPECTSGFCRGGAINPTLTGSWSEGQHAACLSTSRTMQLGKGSLRTVLC